MVPSARTQPARPRVGRTLRTRKPRLIKALALEVGFLAILNGMASASSPPTQPFWHSRTRLMPSHTTASTAAVPGFFAVLDGIPCRPEAIETKPRWVRPCHRASKSMSAVRDREGHYSLNPACPVAYQSIRSPRRFAAKTGRRKIRRPGRKEARMFPGFLFSWLPYPPLLAKGHWGSCQPTG